MKSGVLNNFCNFPASVGLPDNDWNESRWWLAFAGILAFYVFNVVKENLFTVKAPVVEYRSFFEPGWLLGFRFVRGSAPIIQEGYEKVYIHNLTLHTLSEHRYSPAYSWASSRTYTWITVQEFDVQSPTQ